MTCANSEEVSTGDAPPVGWSQGGRPIVTRAPETGGLEGLSGAGARARGDDAVLAAPLRLVERAVGGGDDPVSGRRLREGRDAEADGDVDPGAVGRKDRPLLQGDARALGEARGAVEVGARQDDRELLAAPACRDVDLADRLAQRLGELDEYPVADRMSEAVVDRLEAVEVSEHEGDRAAEALRAHQLARERFLAL